MKRAKPIRKSWMLAILLVMASYALPVEANEKGEQLRRSMAEIALLNSQMAQRKDDAATIREALTERSAEIKQEALWVLRKEKFKSQADALKHPRIYYNLLLMAEIETYIGRYTEKIAYYRIACDRLSYLYQQADDDLKMVNTLSDLKIDALIGQSEKILDRYLSDAQTIVIDPATLAPSPPGRVLAQLKWVKK